MWKEKEVTVMNYDFTFVVNADPHADDFEDKFFEAGCDDATFVLIRGAAAISFDRSAASYKEAVFSAYKQIVKTGAEVLRFEPDFLVSASEIAERGGMTRAAVSLFIKGDRREGFPAPHARINSASPLWDWVSVSKWLVDHKRLPAEVHREALISRIINAGAQINQINPETEFNIESALEAV
jgi:hypothetical protein